MIMNHSFFNTYKHHNLVCLNIHVLDIPFVVQIYIQDFLGSTPELKLSSKPSSPIMDPHLSPDGSMLAFVRDGELHVMNLSNTEVRQLTVGANQNIVVNMSFSMNSNFLLKPIPSSFCFCLANYRSKSDVS